MKQQIILSILAGALSMSTGIVLAAEQDQLRTQDQKQIYGSQFMTQQKREQIRKQEQERMQKRANVRGATLSDEPSTRGRGMGRSRGKGSGRGR